MVNGNCIIFFINKNIKNLIRLENTVWITNGIYIIALVAMIKLAIKSTEALDIYINDKKNII